MASSAGLERVGLVWLHGLGDEPSSWDVMKQLLAPRFRSAGFEVVWSVPAAPLAQVTMQGRAVLTSWFDWYHWPIGIGAPDDKRGLLHSVARVHKAIEALVEGTGSGSGIPRHRIAVGGFSQGAALALNAFFRSPHKLAGCVALSGWLACVKDDIVADNAKRKEAEEEAEKKAKAEKDGVPYEPPKPKKDPPPKKLTAEERLRGLETPAPEIPTSKTNFSSPVFWGHGEFDDVVLHVVAQDAHTILKDAGVPLTVEDYHMRHVSHPDEVDDLFDFLVKAFTEACANPPPTTTTPSAPSQTGDGGGPPEEAAPATAAATSAATTTAQQPPPPAAAAAAATAAKPAT
mmetsp:Transcript_26532/g.81576  ORF Transcript_26532/g.81576 Transcript_26532/m.81576 type:complete len:345 (-) Transcript_26532:117-1151(-)